jgi:hypothetical protein
LREQREQRAVVKRAASIAREVRGWWAKARAVVDYAVAERVEAAKRALLDRELDAFVSQSEKCGPPSSPPSPITEFGRFLLISLLFVSCCVFLPGISRCLAFVWLCRVGLGTAPNVTSPSPVARFSGAIDWRETRCACPIQHVFGCTGLHSS